jgi:hypothetical protein
MVAFPFLAHFEPLEEEVRGATAGGHPFVEAAEDRAVGLMLDYQSVQASLNKSMEDGVLGQEREQELPLRNGIDPHAGNHLHGLTPSPIWLPSLSPGITSARAEVLQRSERATRKVGFGNRSSRIHRRRVALLTFKRRAREAKS